MIGSGRPAGTRMIIAAVAANALTALLLMRAPLYQSSTTTAASDGHFTARTGWVTLLDGNGWDAIVPLLVPVIIAASPLLAVSRRSAVIARSVGAFLLLAFVALGAMTIGFFYLPSALLMTVAAFLAVRPPLKA